MRVEKITEHDGLLLGMIQAFIAVEGYPPTIRELRKLTGTPSTSTVAYRLDKLEKGGYITKKGSKSRTIVLTGKQLPEREGKDETR